MAESRLDVVINPSRAQSGARAVKSSIDEMKNSWIGLTARMFLVEQAVTRTWKAFSQGAEFQENFARLNRQVGQFNQTADQMVSRLQRTVSGQLSMADATQIASRALAQGLNPSQVNTFASAAEALGDVMGTDVKGGFDAILQGLQTGRTQMLANIGVYVDLEKEVKDLAVATNRTTDQITKQEKAAIGATAVIKQLGGSLNELGDGSISTADRMASVEKRLEDIGLKAKIAGANVTASVFAWRDAFAAGAQKMFPILKEWEKWTTEHVLSLPKMEIDKSLQGKENAPDFELDPKLRGIQIKAASDRLNAEIDATRDSMISGFKHQSKLFDFDQQMGPQGPGAGVGEMDFLKAKQNAHLSELALAGEAQNKLLQLETETYRKRVDIGFDTTEAKITAEEAYKTRVMEINGEVAKIVQEFGNVSTESAAEQHILALNLQEELGQRTVASITSTFQIGEDLRHRDQDNAIAYYQNLAKFQDAYGTSRENQMTTEYDMVRASLAKQLDVNQETSGKVLNAWRNNDHIHASELLEGTRLTWDEITTIMMGAMADQRQVSEKFSDDFFGGFAKSMNKYVTDTSVFGLGVDQARRVAQGMEQGFQQFFFDAMEGRIQSFKDVVESLVDFSKKIISQLAGQLITRSILTAVAGGVSGFGGIGAGGSGKGFSDFLPPHASGGITRGPSLAGEAGPEAIVPLPNGRSIPVEWKGGPYGQQPNMVQFNGAPYGGTQHMSQPNVSVPVSVEINNSHAGADVQAESRQGPDGSQQIKIFVTDIVKQGFRNGEFDTSMNQSFGTRRQPVRRG